MSEQTANSKKLVKLGFVTSSILLVVGGGMFFNDHYIGYLSSTDDLAGAIVMLKTSMDLKSAGIITAIFGFVIYLISIAAMFIDRLS